MSKKQPTRRRSIRGSRSPKSDINTKDMDMSGRSMSPTRRAQLDVKPKLRVVDMTVPVEAAWFLLTKLTLRVVIQVVEASPELAKTLNINFWSSIYLENFGRTAEYQKAIQATGNTANDWKELVIRRYQANRK